MSAVIGDPALKLVTMDATLMSELNRLAAEYDMIPDICLHHLMVCRAEHEGTEAVRMMVETTTDLWSKFKPGSKRLKYWAALRECRQALRDGAPIHQSAYAIMERNARDESARKSAGGSMVG